MGGGEDCITGVARTFGGSLPGLRALGRLGALEFHCHAAKPSTPSLSRGATRDGLSLWARFDKLSVLEFPKP
jgi:hypothetical protein